MTLGISLTEHSYCLLSCKTKSSLIQEFVPYSMHTLMFSEDIVQIQQLIANSSSHNYRPSTGILHFSVWQLLRKAVVALITTTPNTSVAHGSNYGTERMRFISNVLSPAAWWTFQNPCILWVTLQVRWWETWSKIAALSQFITKIGILTFRNLFIQTTNYENDFMCLTIRDMILLRFTTWFQHCICQWLQNLQEETKYRWKHCNRTKNACRSEIFLLLNQCEILSWSYRVRIRK